MIMAASNIPEQRAILRKEGGMVYRVEVGIKGDVIDPHGEAVKRKIIEHLGIAVQSVRIVKVYTIDCDLGSDEISLLADELFSDPVIEEFSVEKCLPRDFSYVIEVGFRPGVTDNVGHTSAEAIQDILSDREIGDVRVYTSLRYLLKGDLSAEKAQTIASEILANEVVERFKVVSRAEWDKGQRSSLGTAEVTSRHEPTVNYYDLEVADEELEKISRDGVLSLELAEMKAIRDYYRNGKVAEERQALGLESRPTDVELEAVAQTWSEHCKHKIFNAKINYTEGEKTEVIESLFNTYIKRATEEIGRNIDWLVSVFHDNAGIIKFDDKWNLVFKVETHNSPSALEPYGGALTGIVGVNRDPAGTGLGAKLFFNTDIFCFAPPDHKEPLPPRLLHPKRIFDGVRLGVEHGGNKSGIPTVNGTIVFDRRYAGKPLVFCGTGGIIPSEIGDIDTAEKKVSPEDLIVMTGGRIGKDGIHGATFSSVELDETSPVSAVQIGDPITQKKMLDFLLEARDQLLYRCITDNGAGGLSSSVGEMARLSGGCELDLTKAPLKYQGLDPWEILISEAQERMTLAVAPEKIDDFMDLARRRGVEATILGRYCANSRLHVFHDGRSVAYLDMDFLHDGFPTMELNARWEAPQHEEPDFPVPEDLTPPLLSLMSRLNICSKESVIRQYDHEVQGGSIVKPLCGMLCDGPSDAAVIRPLLGSDAGVVIASGIRPGLSDIDTYHMVANVIDEGIRNAIAVGGNLRQLAGLDNFCWPDPIRSEKTPDGEYKLAQLVRAVKAVYDYCTAFGVPCISGKDSMKNDYKMAGVEISVPPTLLFSVIGKIDDISRAVTMDAKNAGDAVYLLGITKEELGGSEYFAMNGYIGNSVPKVDAVSAKRLYESLSDAIERGLVRSCHDCSEGGLGVALAETAFAGGLGMAIDLCEVPSENVERDDYLLFSESASRFVVTVSEDNEKEFTEALDGNVMGRIGTVASSSEFIITGTGGKELVRTDIESLRDAFKKTLERI